MPVSPLLRRPRWSWFWLVVFATLSLGVWRTCHPAPKPPDDPEAPAPDWKQCRDLNKRSTGHDCPTQTCGSNSPIINAFPIDGLHPGACANGDHRWGVAGSLRARPGVCTDAPMTLDLDRRGYLVGRDPTTGQVRCRGAALVGATFKVAADRDGETVIQPPREAEIMITDMAMIAGTGAGGGRIPAYALAPAGKLEASLCDRADADGWLRDWLGGKLTAGPASRTPVVTDDRALRTLAPSEAGRYAIAMAGEVYDRRGQPMTGGARGWWNLACVGAALAESRIRGLDHRPDLPAAEQAASHRAALMLLTAKYKEGISYTVHGPQIRWRPLTCGRHCRPASGELLEARWGEEGATCLSRARLWRRNTVIPPNAVTERCRDQPCDEQVFRNSLGLPACDESADGTDPAYWETTLVEHVDVTP